MSRADFLVTALDRGMKITKLSIEGLLVIEPVRFCDDRGFFSETFRAAQFEEAAGPAVFVQENHSLSVARGTVRGLHYQKSPRAQGKLVRVVRGAILDVAVDFRRGSPTFGKYISLELSADNWRQLWVPPGFLHGFCTLVEKTEVVYKVTEYYSRNHDAGVRWSDPDIGVEWPFRETDLHLSDKDRSAPLLREIESPFSYNTHGP